MLFSNLLTHRAQIFADVRTYWSPEAIERVSGWKPEGILENGAIHLINSGACTLDGTGQQSDEEGQTGNETILGNQAGRGRQDAERNNMVPSIIGIFPWKWLFIKLPDQTGYACYYGTFEHSQGIRSGSAAR
jgi:L-fucose isomerase-like protein